MAVRASATPCVPMLFAVCGILWPFKSAVLLYWQEKKPVSLSGKRLLLKAEHARPVPNLIVENASHEEWFPDLRLKH